MEPFRGKGLQVIFPSRPHWFLRDHMAEKGKRPPKSVRWSTWLRRRRMEGGRQVREQRSGIRSMPSTVHIDLAFQGLGVTTTPRTLLPPAVHTFSIQGLLRIFTPVFPRPLLGPGKECQPLLNFKCRKSKPLAEVEGLE